MVPQVRDGILVTSNFVKLTNKKRHISRTTLVVSGCHLLTSQRKLALDSSTLIVVGVTLHIVLPNQYTTVTKLARQQALTSQC